MKHHWINRWALLSSACLVVGLCLPTLPVVGQPLLSSARMIEGVEVFSDIKQPSRYYFLPGELTLALEESGRPKFQLLQMRYTGTRLVGDQGAGQFFNVVQIGVERTPLDNTLLKSIKTQLGKGATLDPLPIANLEAYLVMPLAENDGRYQRIGRPAGIDGGTSKKNVWTERHFTVRLDPREAELLWKEVEAGRISFSIAYAYYADAVDDTAGEFSLGGDSTMVEELSETLTEFTGMDSVSTPHVIRAGAISLDLDAEKWPDLCRRIDLNEGAPPAWAFLELRCYDFTNNLRPDLAMKAIEIEATGVTNTPIRLKPIYFSRSRPEEHTREVRFPYAVDLEHPYRFRVKEYSLEGEEKEGVWNTSDSWADLLDLTTQPEGIPYREHHVEVEINTEAYQNAGAREIVVLINYFRDSTEISERISWPLSKAANLPLQLRRFFADRNTSITYVLTVTDETGSRTVGPTPLGADDYLYLSPDLIDVFSDKKD